MSTEPFDSDALRADWVASRSEAPPTAPTEPESHSAPAVPAEPAEAPAEAPPAAPPEGATLGEGQPPAPAAPDDTLNLARQLAGSDDPRALAAKLVEYNNRLAELSRSQRAEAPATTPAAPPTPEPPVEAEPTPEVVQRQVESWAAQDAECVRLHGQYHENKARLQEIGIHPDTGELLRGGQIAQINERIEFITRYLDPEARKRAGIELPELDEFKLADARATLSELRVARADLVTEARERRQLKSGLSDAYDQRLDQAKKSYLEPYQARKREADREAAIEDKAKVFVQSFQQEFDNTFNRYLAASPWLADPELKADIVQAINIRAKADISALDNLGQFMDQAFKSELAVMEKHHRIRSRAYATQKIADTKPQAPPGSLAVAPPLPTSKTDWEASLRREARALRQR